MARRLSVEGYVVPAGLEKKAIKAYDDFNKLMDEFCRLNGLDPDDYNSVRDNEIVNGIAGIMGNAALILDWI